MQESEEQDLGFREGLCFFPDSRNLDSVFYVAHLERLLTLLSTPAAEKTGAGGRVESTSGAVNP
jgi:hypothetical protein